MSDEPKTYSQADIDKLAASVEALEAKNAELVADVRKAKQQARAASEIKPEDMAAVEAERDKALADLAEAGKQVKTLTTERDKAVKALETETTASRSFALEAELSAAIAEGQVLPALVPALKAMVKQQAKADLVDGTYAVTIGDKPAKDYLKSFLDSDDGKHFRAADISGGGGARGGTGKGDGKTITRQAFDAMDHASRAAAIKEGATIVDQAA